MENTSTLLSQNGIISREQLALIETPLGTITHRPIPHHEVVSALIETLGFRHLAVVREQYCCSKDGMKLFGTMELDQGDHGIRFALGLRNSHDRSMALAIIVGYRVMVCDNMAFHGDFTPMMKKHTRNFNFMEALAYAVDQTQRNFTPMLESIARWKETQLSDVNAKLLIYEAFVEGAMELPKHLIRPTHDYYFKPLHQEFAPRTLWSLQNAFTGAIKLLDPIPAHRATGEVAQFFQSLTVSEI